MPGRITGNGTDEDPIRTDCSQCRPRAGGTIPLKDGKCIACGREYPQKESDTVAYSAWICELIGVCKRWEAASLKRLTEVRAECKDDVLAERERCAKIVYAVLDEALADMKQPGLDIYYTFVDIANVIAARIREGT